jgi:CRISPR-associated protein Cas2
MSGFWMVAYDIEDDGVRCDVADILKNYGVRVQYSVFECCLTIEQFAALRQQILSLLGSGDSLRWYPLCTWCLESIVFKGQGKAPDDAGFVFV